MAAEADLEAFAIKHIRLRRGHTRKVKWIGRRGAPDRLVWCKGWLWPELWELKSPGKPLKKHQEREHARLINMGIVCRKIDSEKQIMELL